MTDHAEDLSQFDVAMDEPEHADAVEASDTPDDAPQISYEEKRARVMGWRPREEFKGDPDKWVDAVQFAENADKSLPLAKAEARRANERADRLEAEHRRLQEDVKRFTAFHAKVEEDSFARAREQLRRELIDARHSFDADRELQAEDQLRALDYEQRTRATPQHREPEQQAAPQVDPDVSHWLEDAGKTWGKNPRAVQMSQMVAEEMRKNGEDSTGVAFLEKVKHAMRKEFPQFFDGMTNERRSSAAPVASGAGAAPRGKGKGFADLPADAKQACRDFVKRGFVTEAQYVKEYFGS
jgi:hypothetical protein